MVRVMIPTNDTGVSLGQLKQVDDAGGKYKETHPRRSIGFESTDPTMPTWNSKRSGLGVREGVEPC